MKKIKKWSSSLIIFLLTLGFNVSVFAQTFQTSDFEGNWYVYSIEVDPNMPAVYWVWGEIGVESGNLTGTYYGPDGSSTTLSNGQIALDHKGIITGSLTAGESTATIVHGKLDPSKTKGASVFVGDDGSMDLATFIKQTGTFTTTDMQGDWYIYVMSIDATTGGMYWAYGNIAVDESGNAIGDFIVPDGSIGSVTDATLNLDNQGIITGSCTLSMGELSVNSTVVHGKLDESKTNGAFVAINPDDGSMSIMYLVKSGGTFKQTDASGNWYVYTMNIDPNIPAVYWAYGKAGIDALGNISGSYISPLGESINLTATSQMDNAGLSTGTINFDTGDSGILPSIKLDQGKTSMTGVGIITNGSNAGAMSILHFIKESSIAMPWIPSLLLDD